VPKLTATNSELWELVDLIDELGRRSEHAFSTYTPLSDPEIDQLAYHKSKHWCRLVFGGNRSGKSRVTAQEILWWCTHSHPYQETPKSPRIWVIAPEYRIIYEGIWSHIRDNLPDWEIEKLGVKVPQWSIPTFIKFKKGGQVDFISAEGGESDRRKLQAAEVDLVCIDEEISGDLWIEIEARLITRGGRVNISATLVSSEEWLVDLEQQGEDPNNKEVGVFRLNTEHNIYNSKKAVERWKKKLSREDYEVRILGRSRKTRGIIYRPPPSVSIDSFDLPASWPRVMVFDPGHRVAAALWFALSPDGHRYCYREMYLLYTTLGECVEFVKLAEGQRMEQGIWFRTPKAENIFYRIIDPSAYNTPQDGSQSTADQLLEHYGLDFNPGINNKNQNIEDVRRLFLPEANPVLKVFNNLANFWSEIRKYRLKERKLRPSSDQPRAVPLKRFDHLMNCLEYFASSDVEYLLPESATPTLRQEAERDDEEIDWPEDQEQRHSKKLRIARLRQNSKRGNFWR